MCIQSYFLAICLGKKLRRFSTPHACEDALNRYATLASVRGTKITIWLFPYLGPMLK